MSVIPLRRHHHAGRAQHRAVEPVALLVDLGDGPGLVLLVRLLGDRLVLVGVERLAERRERLDAHAAERGR